MSPAGSGWSQSRIACRRVPTGTDLLEPRREKLLAPAHVLEAGRVAVDRIALDHVRPGRSRLATRGVEQAGGDAAASLLGLGEEADDGPHVRAGRVRAAAEAHRAAVGVARRDRAPRDGLTVGVREQANRRPAPDSGFEFGALVGRSAFDTGRHRAPDHAPAVVGTDLRRLEEPGEVGPTFARDGLELEGGGHLGRLGHGSDSFAAEFGATAYSLARCSSDLDGVELAEDFRVYEV